MIDKHHRTYQTVPETIDKYSMTSIGCFAHSGIKLSIVVNPVLTKGDFSAVKLRPFREEILRIEKITEIIRTLRRKFKITKNPSSKQIKQIAESEDIIIHYENELPVMSFIFYFKSKTYIILKNNLSAFKTAFLIAHELGHYYLHPNLDLHIIQKKSLSKEKIDNEANIFALMLFIPELMELTQESKSLKQLLINLYNSNYDFS